jgi:hypothetical protein
MDPQQHKALFLMVASLLALLVASPLLQKVLVYPQTEFFTELWLLGPQHTAENYPHNITSGKTYSVFLGVTNQLGSCAYYIIDVKFRNLTQSGPDSFNHTCSSLEPLYRRHFFVPNKETWELPLTFSLAYSFDQVIRTFYRNVSSVDSNGNLTYQLVPYNATVDRANFNYLRLNDATLNLQGLSSDYNPQTSEFFGNLIFELWIYDAKTNNHVYHERYVDLKLNMNKTW